MHVAFDLPSADTGDLPYCLAENGFGCKQQRKVPVNSDEDQSRKYPTHFDCSLTLIAYIDCSITFGLYHLRILLYCLYGS